MISTVNLSENNDLNLPIVNLDGNAFLTFNQAGSIENSIIPTSVLFKLVALLPEGSLYDVVRQFTRKLQNSSFEDMSQYTSCLREELEFHATVTEITAIRQLMEFQKAAMISNDAL